MHAQGLCIITVDFTTTSRELPEETNNQDVLLPSLQVNNFIANPSVWLQTISHCHGGETVKGDFSFKHTPEIPGNGDKIHLYLEMYPRDVDQSEGEPTDVPASPPFYHWICILLS